MEGVVIILCLVGVVAFLSYKRGKGNAKREELEHQVQAHQQRDSIRAMSDSELDDKLSNYWD